MRVDVLARLHPDALVAMPLARGPACSSGGSTRAGPRSHALHSRLDRAPPQRSVRAPMGRHRLRRRISHCEPHGYVPQASCLDWRSEVGQGSSGGLTRCACGAPPSPPERAGSRCRVAGRDLPPWVFPAPTDAQQTGQRGVRPLQGLVPHSATCRASRYPSPRSAATYASLLLAAGEPMIYVKEQLGHSSIQVTVDLYGHVQPGENRDAVNRLAALTSDTSLAEAASELSRN